MEREIFALQNSANKFRRQIIVKESKHSERLYRPPSRKPRRTARAEWHIGRAVRIKAAQCHGIIFSVSDDAPRHQKLISGDDGDIRKTSGRDAGFDIKDWFSASIKARIQVAARR